MGHLPAVYYHSLQGNKATKAGNKTMVNHRMGDEASWVVGLLLLSREWPCAISRRRGLSVLPDICRSWMQQGAIPLRGCC